jgi:MscS family membrane protein
MLHAHPDIDSGQRLVVNFDAYNTSSLDIMVYCFTTATQFDHFHAVKQDVMLKIMDIVASHGAEFAFPTQTVFWAGQGGGDLDVATDEATEAASSGNAIN